MADGIPLETIEGVWYGKIKGNGCFPEREKESSDSSKIVYNSARI
jgi:hypothetical protein